MIQIPDHFRFDCDPVADPAAVVAAGNARFTVLTDRLLRLEYSVDGQFTDQPSQFAWFRRQPVPHYDVVRADRVLVLDTGALRLTFRDEGTGFTADTLRIDLVGTDLGWRFDDVDPENLGGTYRTLDAISGAIPLEAGLLSRSGWAVVDDSASLLFRDDGWLAPRDTPVTDLYFLGYGRDYKACLRDYTRISGPVPLLPRWVLGNWWSRYWDYTQQELAELIRTFRDRDLPLSVCIVDMDWHITDTGNAASGWTGYTWNRELFPDPAGFLAWLHDQGLRTSMNLHPADGVWPHEAQYAAMAERLGLAAGDKQPVPFNIGDPAFAGAYFEILHHPHEAQGVDFWWIDWQQGAQSDVHGLDPLWWLNHLHFFDRARDGSKRPFIFSRWGGLGNHRYPVGFSGDTYVDWPSLDFQPYFTATAANVNYGWWSHDIGGHCFGTTDAELYARWVQFGCFSPILRLHATKNAFHDRRPWAHDAETEHVVGAALRLRHALIPYLYTLSWHNHRSGQPPLRPLYHDYPEQEQAYHCPQQYLFGDALLAAPFTTPRNPDTGLSRQVVWLPAGAWYDFFSGQFFAGDAWVAVHGGLRDVPLFAKAGAIVPLGPRVGWGGVDNPAQLEVHLFAGGDGEFTLYEDDGDSTAYRTGDFAETPLRQAWNDGMWQVDVGPTTGAVRHVPAGRAFQFHLHGVRDLNADDVTLSLTIDGTAQALHGTYDAATETFVCEPVALSPGQALRLAASSPETTLLSRRDRTLETCARLLRAFRTDVTTQETLSAQLADLRDNPHVLDQFALTLSETQRCALLETTLQAGAFYTGNAETPHLLLLWNNREDQRVRQRYTVLDAPGWGHEGGILGESGVVPRWQTLTPGPDVAWRIDVDYDGVARVSLKRTPETEIGA